MNTLKPWWPGLFDGDTPRLLACGIRDVLLEDVAQRNIPLSHKKLRRALKAITRSESYLCAMKAGACRYDTEGYVTEHNFLRRKKCMRQSVWINPPPEPDKGRTSGRA
ncbi:IncF plasmid conjugative transfer fertility inhibition protein FinO (plasmid) [Escherichia coli]|nr:IncF plasmid conjugative transfer fertility inhibition protein FinO [Escherichia coli]